MKNIRGQQSIMPKCDLNIVLDEPDLMHPGGGIITGTVEVTVNSDVHCKGLELKTSWTTHGRGNVSSGEGDPTTIFEGEWRQGYQNEYRFELPIPDWPPTYHGRYLNVDHFIEARAKLPWARDPKVSAPFQVTATRFEQEWTKSTEHKSNSSCLGLIAAAVAIYLFIDSGFDFFGTYAWFVGALGIIAAGYFVIFHLLPKWALGTVDAALNSETVSAGEAIEGHLTITPKKSVKIGGIEMVITAEERCVSGSGSNRRTHSHTLLEETEKLSESTTLISRHQNQIPLLFEVPADAAPTLELNDNEIAWTVDLRVDIPRWPDWKISIPIQVTPKENPVCTPASPIDSLSSVDSSSTLIDQTSVVSRLDTRSSTTDTAIEPTSDSISFAETVSHLWILRDDVQQVRQVVGAVIGLKFEFSATIDRKLLYDGDGNDHAYPGGYTIWATHPEPQLPLVLYLPPQSKSEFDARTGDTWQCYGTIVGWDAKNQRLQVKLS